MRIAELKIAKASSPRPKIVKPNKGGSSKHPMRGKLVGEDTKKLDEVAFLAPAIWQAARVATPWLLKQGWRLVKGTTKVAVKNPTTAVVVGTGVAYKDELAAVAEYLKGIGETVEPVIKYVKQYGLPILAVVALLYGGKKIVDMVKNKDPETVIEGEEKPEVEVLMKNKLDDWLNSKERGQFLGMEDLESEMYDYARQLTHDDLGSSEEQRNAIHDPGAYADQVVQDFIGSKYPAEFSDLLTHMNLGASVDNNMRRVVVLNTDGEEITGINLPKDKVNQYVEIFTRKYKGKEIIVKDIKEGRGKPQKPKPFNVKRNPVAKNIEKFNRPVTHQDKKKELKKKGPSIDLDEAPFVVSGGEAINTAISRTRDWLEDQWEPGAQPNLNALQKLGDLAGFTVEPRGKKSVTFNRFFTQTDDDS